MFLSSHFNRAHTAQTPLKNKGSKSASLAISGHRPVVFLLPGLQGSRLRSGDHLVWPPAMQMLRSGIKSISTDAADIKSDGLLSSRYGTLAQHLRKTYDVVEFDFDWRKSMVPQADRLNTLIKQVLAASDQPVHIIAHSMGGLIARMLIARHRPTWERMIARSSGSSLVMLGTPNAGSMSVVWSLLGKDPMLQLFDTVDIRTNMAEILAEISNMPGLLEMLPTDRDDRYFTPAFWHRFAPITPKGWRPPKADALAAAHNARQALILDPEDARHMAYVAGRAPSTPVSIDVHRHQGAWDARMIASKAGDGRVSWRAGQLSNVPCWYAQTTSHRNLPKDTSLFGAFTDLLAHGTTHALPRQPAIAQDESALFKVAPSPPLQKLRDMVKKCRNSAGGLMNAALPYDA